MPVHEYNNLWELIVDARIHIELNPGHALRVSDVNMTRPDPMSRMAVLNFYCNAHEDIHPPMSWRMPLDVYTNWLRACSSHPHRRLIALLFGGNEGRERIAEILSRREPFPEAMLAIGPPPPEPRIKGPTAWEWIGEPDDE
jgi:hypothetical protein